MRSTALLKNLATWWLLFTTPLIRGQEIWVNELHYDNQGSDRNEGIELAGQAGTGLSGCSLILYNGNGGKIYREIELEGSIPGPENGYGTLWIGVKGLQNGSPDGIAIIDDSGGLIQFISYEGSMIAAEGPAAGQESTDIGVAEDGDTDPEHSLQLTGTALGYSGFTWQPASPGSRGKKNDGQVFGVYTDTLAPVFLPGTPRADSTTAGSLYLSVSLNEPGTVFYHITRKDSVSYFPADTVFFHHAGIPDSGTVRQLTICNLEADTRYRVFFLAVDTFRMPNPQNSFTVLEIKTPPELEPLRLQLDSLNRKQYDGDTLFIGLSTAVFDSLFLRGTGIWDDSCRILTDTLLTTQQHIRIPVRTFHAADSFLITFIHPSHEPTVLKSPWLCFHDTLSPLPVNISPANGEEGVDFHDPVLRIGFCEEVMPGNGKFRLIPANRPREILSLNTESGKLHIHPEDPCRLMVCADTALMPGTRYFIEMETGLVHDLHGNPSPRFPDGRKWIFTTDSLPVPPIRQIQFVTDPRECDSSAFAGKELMASGIITAFRESMPCGYYVQDPGDSVWSGLFIACPILPDAVEGDTLLCVGTIQEPGGQTQLGEPVLARIRPGNGERIHPTTLTTGQANCEKYESMLLIIKKAKCTNSYPDAAEWEADDGTGPLTVINPFPDRFTPEKDSLFTITGISEQLNGLRKLLPVEVPVSIPLKSTSIYGFAKQHGFMIYPVPATERIHLKNPGRAMPGSMVDIYNISGVKVFSKKYNIQPGMRVTIDTGILAPGTYSLIIRWNGNTFHRKFLIN